MNQLNRLLLTLSITLYLGLAFAAPPNDGPPERATFGRAVGDLFAQDDFESLERMSNELRQSKARFAEGTWKLAEFYRGCGIPLGSGSQGFEAAEQQVQKWRKQFTNSVTAPIVEAQILRAHGWFFRGSDFASSVTDAGWKQMRKYLEKADRVLDDSREQSSVCPGWHFEKMCVGRGLGWPRKRLDATFEDGVKIAPDYYELYFEQAATLLPRWFGEEGEWQKFAQKQAELHGPEFYSRIAWSMESYYPGKLFREADISWGLMKTGFEKLMRDYPESLWNLNMFCKYACQAHDQETARQLFARIGNRSHPNAWSPAQFRKWKQWANTKNSE
ncbi:MAG: hypothetical protein ACTHLW_04535 [Verrucomicrobiota bacterium]